eukprot:SAG25_NODE_1108_length_3951_cov_1.777259_4_plen_121_part_00
MRSANSYLPCTILPDDDARGTDCRLIHLRQVCWLRHGEEATDKCRRSGLHHACRTLRGVADLLLQASAGGGPFGHARLAIPSVCMAACYVRASTPSIVGVCGQEMGGMHAVVVDSRRGGL